MGCSSTKTLAGDVPYILPQVGFFDKYELADVLGRGAYGTVHLARSVESHEEVAVKIFNLRCGRKNSIVLRTAELRPDVKAELGACARIGRHPNVVGFRGSFVDDNFAYCVMELCVGPLHAAWMNERDLNEYTYARYFKEMAQALAHIHSVGVIHRDVKPDNFMVGAPDGRTVKLCDFGLSAVVDSGDSLSSQFGTAPYMAPEMVTYPNAHGPPADVWSLGVIVYTCFFGHWPYQPRERTAEAMKEAIRDDTLPPSFAPPRRFAQSVVSAVGIRFVRALLDRSPQARPNAASCSQLAYLSTKRCNLPQASGRNMKVISLRPQLKTAMRCGAFNVRTPKADASQEAHLMRLQRTAQLGRETCLSSRPEIDKATAFVPDVAEAAVLPRPASQSGAQPTAVALYEL